MTTKERKGFRCRRSAVVLATVLTVLFAMSAIVYAATDGEVLETVGSAVENIKVWINGSQADADAYVQEDGSIQMKLDEGGSVEVEGDDWSAEGEAPRGFKGSAKIEKDGALEVTLDKIDAATEGAEE